MIGSVMCNLTNWLAATLLAIYTATAVPVSAGERLRWKFESGERLRVTTQQTIKTETNYTGTSVQSTLTLLVETQWDVKSVADGKIELTQKVTRGRIAMESPKSDPVVYDSADENRPTGLARRLQSAIEPHLGRTVGVTMSERGEVLAVELPPPEPADSPEQSAKGEAPAAPADALKSLVGKPLVILPEGEVDEGETWEGKEVGEAAVGGVTMTKTFTLVGVEKSEAGPQARIEADAKIQLQPTAKMKLTDGEFKQTILFDIEDGKIASSEQQVNLKTESPYRETTIVVDVTMTEKTTFERVK